jgi:hypothetical protein
MVATMLLGEGAEPHRLSSPASAEGAREGDQVNDAGVGEGAGGEEGGRPRSERAGAEGSTADLSRLSPGGIVYWAPFPRPFGPRRG